MKFHLAIATAAVALLTLFAPAARAQQPDPKMMAEIQAFQKSLNITPDQKAKIDAIGKKYAPKFQAIQAKLMQKGGKNPSPELKKKLFAQWATETKPLIAAQKKESEAIFTAEQRARIKAFQTKLAAKMKAGGKG